MDLPYFITNRLYVSGTWTPIISSIFATSLSENGSNVSEPAGVMPNVARLSSIEVMGNSPFQGLRWKVSNIGVLNSSKLRSMKSSWYKNDIIATSVVGG